MRRRREARRIVRMSIQDWGAIGEVIGAAAVVVTLLYLTVQLRQNTRSMQSASFHGAVRTLNDFNLGMAHDAELSRIWDCGAKDPESLSAEEWLRFSAHVAPSGSMQRGTVKVEGEHACWSSRHSSPRAAARRCLASWKTCARSSIAASRRRSYRR